MDKYKNFVILLKDGEDIDRSSGAYNLHDLLTFLKKIIPSAEMVSLEGNDKGIIVDETEKFHFLSHQLMEFYREMDALESVYFRKSKVVKAIYRKNKISYFLFYDDGVGQFSIETSLENMINMAKNGISVIDSFSAIAIYYIDNPNENISKQDQGMISGAVSALENAEKMAFYEKGSFQGVVQGCIDEENNRFSWVVIIVAIFIAIFVMVFVKK